ncbi:MAG: hypothetical protein FWH02_07690 [Oscillospiraceae bacterium]|nr:hypothetical protein [Oscillospiraceae bacterium]
MPSKAKAAQQGLVYKGRPMIRSGNTIYYGDMADEHVAMLQLFAPEALADMKLPGKVTIQLISTDETLKPQERVKKRAEKDNLYEAINIAAIWLERI